MNDENKSIDILGIKPIGDAANTVVQATVDGARAFLSRICLPAAEEFGLLLRDKVSKWRGNNLIKIAQKASLKFEEKEEQNTHGHPRIIYSILEQGSWSDVNEVQEMWAGLLVSSCTKDGNDESNIIFINLLSQLTSSEVKMLNYFCLQCSKIIAANGLIFAEAQVFTIDELKIISNVNDANRIDRELDHLHTLGLIDGGIRLDFSKNAKADRTRALLNTTSLALNLFVRCQGSIQSPVDFFNLT